MMHDTKKNTELNAEFALSQLFDIYKKNAKAIWIQTIIFTTLVLVFAFIRPHIYESNTSIMPPKQNETGGISGILSSLSGGGSSGGGGGLLSGLTGAGQGNQSLLFSEILRSRSVANYIIENLNLSSHENYSKLTPLELIDEVQKMIEITVLRNGVIIINAKVGTSYFPSGGQKDSTAVLASKIAALSINALDEIVRNRSTSSARKSREYVENELQNYRSRLDSIEQVLEDFQKENKVLKIDDQTQALVKQAIEVGLLLAKAEMELNVALSEYSASNPLVAQLRSTVEQLKKQYSMVQSGGLTGNDGFSIPFEKIPNLIRQYTNIFRDKKIYEQVILYLETQRHQEAMQESRDIPVVEPLDIAIVPEKQSSPSKKLMLLLGFVLSFIFVNIYHISRYFFKK